jgi:threonine dehydratase
MPILPLSPETIAHAHKRIEPYVHRTPLLSSSVLNKHLGHRILFKAENLQKIGAFKIRGAMNSLLSLKEAGKLPGEVIAFSSGNHSQAVAYGASILGIKSTIFMPAYTSPIKLQATRGYGGNVVLTETRQEAEAAVLELVAKGACFIPPYDSDEVIAGQGTACFEALQDASDVDAVFATCGGGGLISGTYLAAQLLKPSIPVYGGEPLNANDAVQSLRAGHIIALKDKPETLADGAMSISVSERTFTYLQKLAGIFEISETDMIYWTQWMTHLLKATIEPTSAVAMAAAAAWLKTQTSPKTILVIISGGNVAPETYLKIWEHNWLEHEPGK